MGISLKRQPNGIVSVPYSIYTGRTTGSDGIDMALGHGPSGNQGTFTLQIYPDDLDRVVRDLCGVYQLDPVTKWLSRTPPARHPKLTWLTVSRITGVHGVELLRTDGTTLSLWPYHDHLMVTVACGQKKWRIMDDATLDRYYPPLTASDGNRYRQEWRRWTTVVSQTVSETISREGGSYDFVEGGGTGGPTVGQSFQAPWGQRIQKQEVSLTWAEVPKLHALEDSASDRPLNLENIMVVNDDVFLGRPAGTLLYKGYSYQSTNEAPYPPDDLDFLPNYEPSLTVDVILSFEFFDPPRAAGNTTRGHNLAPFNNGLWYAVAPTGDHSKRLYASFPFPKLFSLPG